MSITKKQMDFSALQKQAQQAMSGSGNDASSLEQAQGALSGLSGSAQGASHDVMGQAKTMAKTMGVTADTIVDKAKETVTQAGVDTSKVTEEHMAQAKSVVKNFLG